MPDEWDESTPPPHDLGMHHCTQSEVNTAALVEHGKRIGDLIVRVERLEETARKIFQVAETALKVAEFTRKRLTALKQRLTRVFTDDETHEG